MRFFLKKVFRVFGDGLRRGANYRKRAGVNRLLTFSTRLTGLIEGGANHRPQDVHDSIHQNIDGARVDVSAAGLEQDGSAVLARDAVEIEIGDEKLSQLE